MMCVPGCARLMATCRLNSGFSMLPSPVVSLPSGCYVDDLLWLRERTGRNPCALGDVSGVVDSRHDGDRLHGDFRQIDAAGTARDAEAHVGLTVESGFLAVGAGAGTFDDNLVQFRPAAGRQCHFLFAVGTVFTVGQ